MASFLLLFFYLAKIIFNFKLTLISILKEKSKLYIY